MDVSAATPPTASCRARAPADTARTAMPATSAHILHRRLSSITAMILPISEAMPKEIYHALTPPHVRDAAYGAAPASCPPSYPPPVRPRRGACTERREGVD